MSELDNIAWFVSISQHGGFLKTFALTWMKADPSNKALLKGAWEKLIKKYDLQKEYEEYVIAESQS